MKIKAGLKKTSKLQEWLWKGSLKHWKVMSSYEI